jgi:4-hydroxybutyrate CoA-transferase
LSKNGRAIIAMPSTAAKGAVSRIVALLDEGAAVTTSRNDVDYIITEYGIAPLKRQDAAAAREESDCDRAPRFSPGRCRRNLKRGFIAPINGIYTRQDRRMNDVP